MSAQSNIKDREGIYVSSPIYFTERDELSFCELVQGITGHPTWTWKTTTYHPKYPSSNEVIGLPRFMIAIVRSNGHIGIGTYKEIEYCKENNIPVAFFFEDGTHAQRYREQDVRRVNTFRPDSAMYAIVEKFGNSTRESTLKLMKKEKHWEEIPQELVHSHTGKKIVVDLANLPANMTIKDFLEKYQDSMQQYYYL